ncbi:MAG: hypothetical protein AB7O92_01170 [Acidimicrobiia bacterium]
MAAPEGIPGVPLTGRWLVARQPEAGQAVVSSFDDPGEALRAAGVGRTGAAIGMTVDSHDEERLTRLIARAAAPGQTLLTPSAAR